jgi:hypothetical protein
MAIVVPTFMREHRQKAFLSMPPEIQERTRLYTHSGRADLLQKSVPSANVIDLGVTDGIADVRQKVIDHVFLTHEKVIIIDDKCQFMTSSVDPILGRRPGNTWIRGDGALDHWTRLLSTVSKALDTYPQVGISPRPGNNRHEAEWMTPGRAYSVYGINIASLRKLGVTFDGMYRRDNRVKLYEDFYLTLSLLTRGVPNAVWYGYCFQTDHGKEGGNNTIRTNELQKLCAEALQREFPEYVKVVPRESKTFKIPGQEEFRWEVVIQWKKALLEAQAKNASLL